MRLWLRRKEQESNKRYAVHEFDGSETACFAVMMGMKLDKYDVTGVVYVGERVCQSCQTAIAVRRGKF